MSQIKFRSFPAFFYIWKRMFHIIGLQFKNQILECNHIIVKPFNPMYKKPYTLAVGNPWDW